MQDRGVIAAEPEADPFQAGSAHHFQRQQHGDMPGQDQTRQATPTEKLAARQTELLGDDVLDQLGR
jgi:hypothetical protein